MTNKYKIIQVARDVFQMKIKTNDLYLFATIFLLTLSHCVAYVGTKVEAIIEYSGYLLLLMGIIISFFRHRAKYRRAKTALIFFIVLVLLSIGIFLQDLTIFRKITLLFTVVAISIVSTLSERFLIEINKLRVMAYACLFGVLISTCICLILDVPIVRYTSEATFGIIYYFNGGIRDKNVATMMIAIIISLYVCSKERGTPKPIDQIVSFLCALVLIAANSRGAWIEYLVFALMLNYRRIGKVVKAHRVFFVLFIVLSVLPFIILFYNGFVMKSETYLFRYRGLMNYISKYRNDAFHMIFGNAEMAYKPGVEYAYAVRSVTGWNGTIENSWLNILIKSGILGIIAYIIIFVRAIITAIKCDNVFYKTIYLSVTVMLIISSFVAIYIQTIHGLFGIYCYLVMGLFSRIIRDNRYFKANDLVYITAL